MGGHEGIIATDNVSGAQLRPEPVAQARKEEVKYIQEIGVYDTLDINECWAQPCKAAIAVRWMDIIKSYETHPNFSSRLMAKEFKTDLRPELYAATPPSECLRKLTSEIRCIQSVLLCESGTAVTCICQKKTKKTEINANVAS